MAKKPTKKRAATPVAAKDEGRVTRITASESSSKKPSRLAQARDIARQTRTGRSKPSKKTVVSDSDETTSRNPLTALLRYIRGSWYELRQVRWPDRQSTWSMTGALITFTVFFLLFVMLIDAIFKYLFKLILG